MLLYLTNWRLGRLLAVTAVLTLLCGPVTRALAQNSQMEQAMMDFSKITNPAARAAIEAFQKGDRTAWLAAFASDAKLTDDGNPRSFASFSNEALGHERFTSFDEVKDGGLSIVGQFHSDQWGNFKTYFRFHLGAGGKISQLDIGQAG